MGGMFGGCESLSSLPDLSKWDTSNVIDMRGLFYGCKKLISLDISKCNVYKVRDMSAMFLECESLKYLPGIEKWNTGFLHSTISMFEGCKSLSPIPKLKSSI